MHLRRTLALAIALTSFASLSAQPATRLQTAFGPVVGSLTADGKVAAFKGIPFAAPPVGDLRWRPPQPSAPWTAPLDATRFGHRCFQTDAFNDMTFHDSGASEDCLNLNIWTPATSPKAKLPVVVWIYGGGFLTGGTSEYRQNGEELARRGVVVVSMNYRLGVFGFLTLPGLTAESPQHASGNYGLMDMAAALQWVRRNTANFGGDPANVTIFGESAGSFAVSTLMASPASKDLFQKAIGESGGAFRSGGLGYLPRAELEQRDAAFMQRAFNTVDLAELRKLSADDVLRSVIAPVAHAGAVGGRAPATNETPQPRFGPCIDGWFLPDSVENIYAAAKQAHVPLLAGWNSDEGRNRVLDSKPPFTAAAFRSEADRTFGAQARDFLAVYPAATEDEARESAADYAGDQFIGFSTWRWIESHTRTGGAPVYRYLFTLGSPGDQNHSQAMGAFHSDEIEYVFGVLDSRPAAAWRPEDRKLSDQMMQYWTNFAKTGDPNVPGLPTWPKYGPEEWQVMLLGANSKAAPDKKRPRYLFLDGQRTRP